LKWGRCGVQNCCEERGCGGGGGWYRYRYIKFKTCAAVFRIRDVYPGSLIMIFTHPRSGISDPGSRIQKEQQKRVLKKNCFGATKFTKVKIILILKY
jgi:hypothetical protein